MKKILFSILLSYTSIFSFSQTLEERKSIIKSNDAGVVSVMKKQANAFSAEKKQRVSDFFKKNPDVLKRFKKGNVTYEVVDVSTKGTPIYYSTTNEGSSKTIKASSLNTGGDLGLNVNGENMVAGVWDEGLPLTTHVEFAGGKIIAGDQSTNVALHPTHVIGTIAALGVDSKAKGMAPQAKVISYDWNNDIDEMIGFADQGYLVSNHSYGLTALLPSGYVLPTFYYGAYIKYSYFADLIAYAYKNYQIVKSAGNDRKDALYLNPHKHGYELLTTFANSKNVLTIGSIVEVLNYKKPSDIKLSNFSNPGPTDDGRIKPNLVAKGTNVYSTFDTPGNQSYGLLSGTSMSTPAITGAVLLLQQHYKNLNSQFMQSATVRGILQHTALEAGEHDGPDYMFGWGLADIKTSAEVIINNKTSSLMEENILKNGQTYTKVIGVDDDKKPLIVSISWTDLPAENFNNLDTDPEVKYLVNDLDVRVTDPSGKTYYPWKLDGKNPSLAATKGDNVVDNFERIDIPNPVKGNYTITVSHKGNLQELDTDTFLTTVGNQDYTLIATGSGLDLDPQPVVPPAKLEVDKIYPNPAKDILHIPMQEAGKYEFYEITGKLISSGNLSKGENAINISHFSKGVYILKLKNGSKSNTQKIIIQ